MATFSNNIKITDVVLNSTIPQYSQRAWTGTELRRSVGIQYYKIQFTLNFEVTDRQEVQAFIAQYAQGKPFTLSLGHLAIYQGTQSGQVQATANVNKGSMVIPTNANTLNVGDLVQFSNHNKLYQIVEKNGNNLTIFPQLRQNVGINEIINYSGLQIEATLDVDQTFDMNIANVTQVQFKASENLQ
ncbi:hypothetical protein RJ495_005101 [Pluralibacter gergoviae]|nr:hypothetical protein [Pluralibacter gergoviae]ELD4303987.1 hypothetical protein [Pluralibacter gergoviae]